jgi:hypothetical protein
MKGSGGGVGGVQGGAWDSLGGTPEFYWTTFTKHLLHFWVP